MSMDRERFGVRQLRSGSDVTLQGLVLDASYPTEEEK